MDLALLLSIVGLGIAALGTSAAIIAIRYAKWRPRADLQVSFDQVLWTPTRDRGVQGIFHLAVRLANVGDLDIGQPFEPARIRVPKGTRVFGAFLLYAAEGVGTEISRSRLPSGETDVEVRFTLLKPMEWLVVGLNLSRPIKLQQLRFFTDREIRHVLYPLEPRGIRSQVASRGYAMGLVALGIACAAIGVATLVGWAYAWFFLETASVVLDLARMIGAGIGFAFVVVPLMGALLVASGGVVVSLGVQRWRTRRGTQTSSQTGRTSG